MHARLGNLNKHYMLCRYGRVGREAARGPQREKERLVLDDLLNWHIAAGW